MISGSKRTHIVGLPYDLRLKVAPPRRGYRLPRQLHHFASLHAREHRDSLDHLLLRQIGSVSHVTPTSEYLALERTVTMAGDGGGLPGSGGGASQRALDSRIRSPITHNPGGTDRNTCLRCLGRKGRESKYPRLRECENY